MRASKRFNKRGFTLVELMIVVAIIGVLAALAIYGVSKYLASAKTSEAKNNVGAITRAAVAAYERESYANAMLGDGTNSVQATHARCGDVATRVPAATPANTKYQPNRGAGADFNTGDSQNGWQCLQFTVDQPIYFSYGYLTGPGTGLSGATASGFEVNAFGDLDGDGAGAVVPGANISTFARGADIDANGSLKLSTTIFIQNETE